MENETAPRAALNRAIAEVGGTTALMRALNARARDAGSDTVVNSHNVIGRWLMHRVPANYCPDIEALTAVPCEELRPDVSWSVLRKTAAKVRARLRVLQTETTTEG